MFTYTKEQLASWKEKYGEVFEISCEDKKAILKKPSRKDLSFAIAGSNQAKDSVKFAEILLKPHVCHCFPSFPSSFVRGGWR